MRYFKVYHGGCRVRKAYYELSEGEFHAECGDYAVHHTGDIEEDGSLDYDRIEAEMDAIIAEIVRDAKREDGFDFGDYTLYMRDDEQFDMYDLM